MPAHNKNSSDELGDGPMTIKPWREIAVPHEDVLKGTFQESEFAADISQVSQGKATPEYQDPAQFFARTYVTEGMALLLDSVVKRLAGQGGDPVIQLQTAFGGGKTHTMLAVYHLAKGERPTSELNGIAPVLDQAGITELPKARVAVIDGINLAVSEPKIHGAIRCHTLWGELAWQLGGEEGYELVRTADETGTSPDKDTVIQLLSRAAPCVILMDELVAFYRQFQEGRSYPAGSFETNMTFIQALTEGIKSVPRAIMLASLPDSHNAGEGRGQVVLAELENYFRRLHKIWKPVTKDEAFSIVRRRLFDRIEDQLGMEETCRAFAEFYVDNKNDLPNETQEGRYLDRMKQAYPIHPEIFDRLYEDWSTLAGFQRTRGVLQLLAQVVHRVWKDGNSDAMIMPGSLPLYDATVRNKCLDFLPQGWDPVIDQDIDGEHSKPADIDHQPIFGKIQAGRRTARTIFLGSAPGSAGKMVKGLELERILLGVSQPGQSLGHYKDALKRLVDRLNYINVENNRFWFDITPNLRREMEARKQRFNLKDDVIPLLRSRVNQVFAKSHSFAGIHVFTDSADVPDEYGTGPRLVVLPPNSAYSRGASNTAFSAAEGILRNRGDQPRQKQNRLLFLAPDYDVVSRLNDQVMIYLAWSSIVSDIDAEKLVLDTLQVKQAQKQKSEADASLLRLIRECFKWLICPSEEFVRGKPSLHWEAVSVSTTAPNLIAEIENKLREEEWLISEWSPIHLTNVLKQWYFKDGVTEVSALKVWQDCCHYLYLPRLANNHVFDRAITQGLETEDFFGFASGKDGDRYLGFAFGRISLIALDASALLISRERAAEYKASIAPPPPVHPQPEPDAGDGKSVTPSPTPPGPTVSPVAPPTQTAKKQFYATVTLDPVKAKMDFATIVDEVVEQFTAKLGVEVKISIDIQATSRDGFDEGLQRAVKENCNHLKFGNAEFE
jgi:predicted AAA+ superfamily ATPase